MINHLSDNFTRRMRCQNVEVIPFDAFPVKHSYVRIKCTMSSKTFVREKPLEMIVSKKKVIVDSCMQAIQEITVERLKLRCKKVGSVLQFSKGENTVCSLGFTEYGIIILSRRICPEFVMVIRLSIVTIDELCSDKENDLELLEAIFGEKLFVEEEEEVTPLDHEFVDLPGRTDVDDSEEDSDDFEWI